MKGIILAGGSGSRLHPLTLVTSKQLLPIYNKPMIYYPLSTLILAGIYEILIITTPEDSNRFKDLLGDGSHMGLKLSYAIQEKPEGIAQAFTIGKNFIGSDCVALILGDNIFHGSGFVDASRAAITRTSGATIFGYAVKDPSRYGVVEIDKFNRPLSIEEKPVQPKSNYAVTGLYFYDSNVASIAQTLKPSARGELEITDLNKVYMSTGTLNVEIIRRGNTWLDTGTHASLMEASQFVHVIEERTGMKIAAPEESAWRMGFMTSSQLSKWASSMNNEYGHYLLDLVK